MKRMVKKVAASLLAFMLIVTMLPADVTSAAAKKPKLSATTKTITVGKTTKLTVKNKVKGSTYKWISKNTKIARVSQKGTIRGVKAGKTSIVCKIKAGKKNYRLVCRVTVKKPSQKNQNISNEPVLDQTVSNQKDLNEALKNTKLQKLTIDTKAIVSLEIPNGNYKNVALIVNAPNADVTNQGVFKSIDIKAIKGDTWYEKATGNSFSVLAEVARIVVDAGAKIVDLAVNQGSGSVKIEAQGSIENVAINADAKVDLKVDGSVGKVDVNAPAVLDVKGDTKEAIAVKVAEAAKGAELTASTAVEVKADANVSVKLEKGAEGSKVSGTKESAEIALKNDTAEKVVIETPSGSKEVGAGQSVTHTVQVATSTDPGTSTWTGTESHVSLKGVSGTTSETVEVGKQIQLVPVFDPVNATNKRVYWSISDASKAYLNYNGVVTGRQAGETTVTVSTDEMGYKHTWTIHVVEASLTGIKLSQTALSMTAGEATTLTASPVPGTASITGIQWSSDNTDVATVDTATGKITAVSAGAATITATTNGVSASCTVTVSAAQEGSYTVTFNVGSDTYATKNATGSATLAAVKPADPVKTGYTFSGWSETSNGTVVADTTGITGEKTFYAVFAANSYTINFYDSYTKFEKQEQVSYGNEYTAPNITGEREGYEFLGWATSFSASKPELTAGQSVPCNDNEDYYAIWKVKMIKYVESGSNVLFYNYEFKNENGENAYINSGWSAPATVYMSYASGESNVMNWRFKAENGHVITSITLDGTEHKITEEPAEGSTKNYVQKAVEQGYVVVDRKTDHTITVKAEATNTASITVSAKDGVTTGTTGEGNTTYVIASDTGVSLSNIINVFATWGSYTPELSYEYTQTTPTANWKMQSITSDQAVFSAQNGESTFYAVDICAKFNGIQLTKKCIYIRVDVPVTNSPTPEESNSNSTD